MCKKLIAPLIIFALLISAIALRFNVEASKNNDIGVIQWERDRWTGDCWLKIYGVTNDGPANAMVLSSAGNNEEALKLRSRLTLIWWGLVVADLLWLAIIGIGRKRKKPYDPVLETYKQIFPEEK